MGLQLVELIETFLGPSKRHSEEEVSFFCPFCNHHKPKLQLNVKTQAWRCWVCPHKGRNIVKLAVQLSADSHVIELLKEVYESDTQSKNTGYEKVRDTLALPKEYKPLWKPSPSIMYNKALNYILHRGISYIDIVKYQLGYCDSGPYKDMIIIPSFDANGLLNFFTGRSFNEYASQTHLSPKVDKTMIGFEFFINWNLPVTLVEGALDAISIQHNAIPLFGKQIVKESELECKLQSRDVQTVYVCLDNEPEAQECAREICDWLMGLGKTVYNVSLPGKDPNKLGHASMMQILKNTNKLSEHDTLMAAILSI